MKRKMILAGMIIGLAAGILLGCGSDENKETLTVFNYGEYMDPEVLDLFEEETGIKVKYEEALTPEELYSKYSSGAIKYDLLCTSDYMLQRLIDEGELQTFDTDSLEYKSNIGEKYWEIAQEFDPGNQYIVPYFWGTVGILYDKTKVAEPIDSWKVLFNGQYSGDLVMQNSIRDAYMVALKYLGYSLNTQNEDEIRKAHEILVQQKPDVQAYLVDEARDEVVAGNVAMAVVYSGEAYLGHQYNENLEYVVPKEGSNIWLDGWGITKYCENTDAAKQFLDFLCREDIAEMNFEYIYYSTPNEAVIENMDEELRNDKTIVPEDSSTENCELFLQMTPEITELYNDLWKELKAN